MERPGRHYSSRLVRRVRESLAPLAFFVALSAGFLWLPLATGKVFLPTDLVFRYDHLWKAGRDPSRIEVQNPLLADVSDYYHPYRVHALEELRQGRFPLWNPWILAGTPFFASAQAALLDPVNVLTLPTGPLASWTWGALVRLALLGWLTFGFARVLGRSTLGATAAGIVFMISGVVVVWLNFPVVTSLVWMPALFWASTRFVESGGRRALAATAFSVAALLVGGHPETQFLVGIAWGAYVLHALLAPEVHPVAVRRLAGLALAVALGLAASAVQWLPFVDFLLGSHAFGARAHSGVGAPFDAFETLMRLAVLVLPNLGGTRVGEDYWLPESDYLNFNERTGYVGCLALGLAWVGFRAARRAGGAEARRALFFGVATLVAVLLAIRAPVFHLVRELPLLQVGHGVRWVIVSSFFAALLAGRGVDALRGAGPGSRELRRGAVAFGALAGAGLVALGVAWASLAHGLEGRRVLAIRSHGEITLAKVDVLVGLLDPSRFTVSPPLLYLLAGAVVFFALARGALRPRAAALALGALLYFDLWTFGHRYNPVNPASEVFPPTPQLRFLQEHLGRERVVAGGDLLRPNVSMLFGLRDLRGYEDVVDHDFDLLYGETLARLREKLWVGVAPKIHDPRLEREDVRLLQLASVRYLLSVRPLRGPLPLPYTLVSSSQGIFVYEAEDALPRAYAVLRARFVPSVESAREALLDPRFDPFREVVLVGEAGTTSAGPSVGVPSLAWRRDEPEIVEIEASLPAPGHLVLTDRYSPDWEASVDGEPVPLLRANGVFRAVAVAAGTHRVRLQHRPRLFYASAGVSAAAVAASLLLLVLPQGHRRKLACPSRAPQEAKR